MKNIGYFIPILLFLIFGCKSESNNPYKDIDFNSGDFKLYFIGFDNEFNIDTSGFKRDYPNFYIDNVETLSKLEDMFFTEPIENTHVNISYELVIITKDDNTYFGGWIDLPNNKIKYSKTYNLDFKKFSEYRNDFKNLNTNHIKIKSIRTAKDLIDKLEKSGGYIYGLTNNPKETMLDFDGVFKLLTDSTQINNHQTGEQLRKQINQRFSKYGSFKLGDMSFMKQDSFELQFYCDSNFYYNLADRFQILEPFTDSVDFSFKVYGLLKEKIIEESKAIGIEELEFIE
jgi:hypothetical protein